MYRMKCIISILLFLMTVIECNSQSKGLIHLWPGKVPGEAGEKKPAVISSAGNDNILRFSEVTDPAVEVFLPEHPAKNCPAMIVCPGGGYRILAYDLEGSEIAAWLNKAGIAAFVLQYRIPDKKEGALQDVQRAVRLIRQDAPLWGVDPGKIGVMGFSAGGSLAARASTLFNYRSYPPADKADSLSCRPSFAMLIYPAYLDQGPGFSLTPELQITGEVPPVFIFQTADDQYGNSALVMAKALRDSKLSVELHLLPVGGHGYGLRAGSLAAETWPLLGEKWMKNVLHLSDPR
jgi:acetyl esterase/lipase